MGNKTREKEKKEHMGLRQWLMDESDLPAELFCGGCYLEIHGRNSILIRGCRKIVFYSKSKIILKMHKNIVKITGKMLTCITYLAGAVSVEGYIDAVEFVGGQNKIKKGEEM